MGVLPVEQNRKLDRLFSRAKLLAVAAVLGALAVLLLLFVAALVAVKTGNFTKLGSVGVYVSALLGGIAAGLFAAKRSGKNGLIIGAAAALVTALLMWLAALIPGNVSGAVPLSAVICVAGGAGGGLIGVHLTYR